MNAAYIKLLNGHKSFKSGITHEKKDLYTLLANGQSPKSLIIACIDSRVDPIEITQSSLGELFVLRSVANLVPKFDNKVDHSGTISAIQFAVNYLNIENIIILGHSGCGGIASMLDQDQSVQKDQNEYIKDWMQIAEPALSCLDNNDSQHSLEKQSILNSMQNCLTYPWIKSRVDNMDLEIHGWYFDIENAELSCCHINEGQFILV